MYWYLSASNPNLGCIRHPSLVIVSFYRIWFETFEHGRIHDGLDLPCKAGVVKCDDTQR